MALENVVNIADLVNTNPPDTDPKSQGAAHLRNIKTALLNDFAGFTGAVGVAGVDGGAANAYTLTPSTALPAYGLKMAAAFIPNANNTGPATLNISGLGAKTIKRVDGTDLTANDLLSGSLYLVYYDGTNFKLFAPTKNYCDQLAFSAALPAQALGLLTSNGSTAQFGKNLAFALNFGQQTSVASSATPDIWSGNGNSVHITGNTTITGFIAAPQAGTMRWLIFDGTPQLTNSANLNLPGGINITMAAGDMALVYADTTTVFDVVVFRKNGTPVASLVQYGVTTAQFNVASNTTLANVPGLTANLIAGGTYKFSVVLTVAGSGGGVKFAMGGTATATSFMQTSLTGSANLFNGGVSTGSAVTTTFGAATGFAAGYGADTVVIEGTIVCNAGGTLTVQFAQNASSVTNSSVFLNSSIEVSKMA